MNEDNVKGTLDKVTGKLKEALGDLTGNEQLKAEGKLDQVKGAAQDSLGHAKDAGHGVVDSLKKATD